MIFGIAMPNILKSFSVIENTVILGKLYPRSWWNSVEPRGQGAVLLAVLLEQDIKWDQFEMHSNWKILIFYYLDSG